MTDSRPKYDSSCEYGTYLDRITNNIPDRYNCIDVGFEFLVPIEFPNAYDGRYLITVYTWGNDKTIKEYIISLDEAKYIYNSDKLPEDIRDIVINSINNNYKAGIASLIEECGNILDPDKPIPDYTQL